MQSGTSLPFTCAAGDIFRKTDAPRRLGHVHLPRQERVEYRSGSNAGRSRRQPSGPTPPTSPQSQPHPPRRPRRFNRSRGSFVRCIAAVSIRVSMGKETSYAYHQTTFPAKPPAAGLARRLSRPKRRNFGQRPRAGRDHRPRRHGYRRHAFVDARAGRRTGGRRRHLPGPSGSCQRSFRQGRLHHARLSRGAGAQGHRRGHHRHARSLALADLDRRHERGQGRVLRKAHGAAPRRRQAGDRSAAEDRTHSAGGQPARQLDRLPESQRTISQPAPSAS